MVEKILMTFCKVRSEDLVKASNMIMSCAMEANEQASVRGFVMVDEPADYICDVDYVDDHIFMMVFVVVMNMIIRYAMEANGQASVDGLVMAFG